MSEWITQAEAARLAGCSNTVIERYLKEGRIARRWPPGRKTPTVDRESAEEFAVWWRQRKAEAERRQQEREERRPVPPEDGEVWLDSTTAALVLGCTPQWLLRLAAAERVPAVRRSRRWFFRRRDVEVVAAARAFVRRLDSNGRLVA